MVRSCRERREQREDSDRQDNSQSRSHLAFPLRKGRIGRPLTPSRFYYKAPEICLRGARPSEGSYRNRRRPPEHDADLAFLKEAAALAERPRDLEKYAALFRFKGERLSGDISPGYYDLDGDTIGAIARRFPQIKIVLMVREPLERVWSHLSMRSREGHFDAGLLADVNAFARWFAQSEVRRACFATKAARRWAEHAPAVAFRPFFFDDVEADARAPRAKIIEFVGGDARRRSGKLAAGYNRKANLPKLPLPEPVRAFLLAELAEEIRGCANLFGGPAARWPARYGL